MKKMKYMMMTAAVIVGVAGIVGMPSIVNAQDSAVPEVPAVPAIPGKNYSSELTKLLERFKGILNTQGDTKCNADNKRICKKIEAALEDIKAYTEEDLPKIQGDATKFSTEASPLVEDLDGLRDDVVAITKMKPHAPTTFPGKCIEYTTPTSNGWVRLQSGSRTVYQLYHSPSTEEKPFATISPHVGAMGTTKEFLPSTVVNQHVQVVIQNGEVVCIGKTIN